MTLGTNKIWEELREPLKRFIARRVKNEHDAEDILQNIFCKIHNSIDNLKDESKLHPGYTGPPAMQLLTIITTVKSW